MGHGAVGHAAFVVGIHGDVVGQALGQAVDRRLAVAPDRIGYHLPMGMEPSGINAPADHIALGALHGIPANRHVAGVLAAGQAGIMLTKMLVFMLIHFTF